jgi:hypothetical protein
MIENIIKSTFIVGGLVLHVIHERIKRFLLGCRRLQEVDLAQHDRKFHHVYKLLRAVNVLYA